MHKVYSITLIIIIVTIIGLLQLWSAPTLSDDIIYRFVWQKDWLSPLEPIRSINDIIKSQIIHYYCINGRVLLHFIAQMLLNLTPESVYKTLNTIMFIILIGSIVTYVSKDKTYFLTLTAITFGMLFLIINGFGTGFIWIMGAVNYTWGLVFTMAFLWILHFLGKKEFELSDLFFILISFCLGWTHEAIALPIFISNLIFIFINRKQNLLRRTTTWCMMAYCCGMIMILLSPALWERTDFEGISLSKRLFYGCINIIFGMRISWILIITLFYILIINKQLLKKIIIKHYYLLIAWLIALGIVFVCGTTLDRVSICADFLAILIVLQIWMGKWMHRYEISIVSSIIVISILIAIPAIKFSYINYQNYKYHYQQLEQKNSHIIKVRQLPYNMPIWINKIAKRYVNPTIEFNYYNVYMAFDCKDVNNKCVAKLFNKDWVLFLPEDVVDNIQENSRAYLKYDTDIHHNLFIQQLKSNQQVNHVSFILDEEVPLYFYQRIMSYPDYKFELDDFKYEVLNIANKKFLVMTVPPNNITRRIKNIFIEYKNDSE